MKENDSRFKQQIGGTSRQENWHPEIQIQENCFNEKVKAIYIFKMVQIIDEKEKQKLPALLIHS